MKRIIYLICVCMMLYFPKLASATHSQEVKAIVNNEIITSLDVSKRLQLIMKVNKLSNDPALLEDLRQQVLNMLIDEKLISQDAGRLRISVQKSELEQAVERLAAGNNMKKKDFLSFLRQEKIDSEVFYDQLRGQMLWMKLIQMQFRPYATVYDDELRGSRLLYQRMNNKVPNKNLKVKLAEIVLYIDSENQERVAKLLEKLTAQIKMGVNFESLVSSFSQSSTAKNRGLIGWIRLGDLVPEIGAAIAGLDAGGVSRPIQLGDSIAVYKVLEKEGISVASAGKINDDELRNFLVQRKIGLQAKNYLYQLKNSAFIEAKN